MHVVKQPWRDEQQREREGHVDAQKPQQIRPSPETRRCGILCVVVEPAELVAVHERQRRPEEARRVQRRVQRQHGDADPARKHHEDGQNGHCVCQGVQWNERLGLHRWKNANIWGLLMPEKYDYGRGRAQPLQLPMHARSQYIKDVK
ncbi:hypothetical protein KL919_004625 [Ogataea angusta]|uniref:Uncharacterized protein n=1 Tax=Pichia angusta TaxID=870730 RepID=A0AAN6DB54_PICAN|nr:uncharacterized protein KL928_004798 [Ogataea angusta]KAG7816242.1 hypothetical protein KL928_004798 [Ogataea angusta]KAG7855485.1 hypothetical protein KL919_004625 [Ogataea angusta]